MGQEHHSLAARPARSEDIPAIAQFFREARRRHVTFGEEDIGWLLQHGVVFVGTLKEALAGVLVVTEATPGWGFLRAVALAENVSVVAALRSLLAAASPALRTQGIRTVYSIVTDAWLHAGLEANGFRVVDRIVTLVRAVAPPQQDVQAARVRVAQPDELPLVAEVDAAAFPPPWRYTEGMLKVLLATGCRLTVAERRNRIVGYACVQQQGEWGHIVRLAVHPDFQGEGIGRGLLTDAMRYLAEHDARYCTLNTQASNRRALRLYESFGFRRHGRTIPVMAKEL